MREVVMGGWSSPSRAGLGVAVLGAAVLLGGCDLLAPKNLSECLARAASKATPEAITEAERLCREAFVTETTEEASAEEPKPVPKPAARAEAKEEGVPEHGAEAALPPPRPPAASDKPPAPPPPPPLEPGSPGSKAR